MGVSGFLLIKSSVPSLLSGTLGQLCSTTAVPGVFFREGTRKKDSHRNFLIGIGSQLPIAASIQRSADGIGR